MFIFQEGETRETRCKENSRSKARTNNKTQPTFDTRPKSNSGHIEGRGEFLKKLWCCVCGEYYKIKIRMNVDYLLSLFYSGSF